MNFFYYLLSTSIVSLNWIQLCLLDEVLQIGLREAGDLKLLNLRALLIREICFEAWQVTINLQFIDSLLM